MGMSSGSSKFTPGVPGGYNSSFAICSPGDAMRLQIIVFALFIGSALAAFGCGAKPGTPALTNTNAAAQNTPAVVAGSQTVSVLSADKTPLAGTFFAAGKPDSPGVLMLHQWQSDRHAYDDLARRMQAKGFAVLSIDGRGFGESTKTGDGRTLLPQRTDAAVEAMVGDVGAAFEFLKRQKNVAADRCGIIGASYSSSLALLYAAIDPRLYAGDDPNVYAVALLSPGLNYFGNMPTEPAKIKYGWRPILLIAADDDKESADAVDKLRSIGSDENVDYKVFPSGGHGTALFGSRPETADILEGFFVKHLKPHE